MIVSENNKPELQLFQAVMQKTDNLLNEDARQREEYYSKRSGKLVEGDVYSAVCEASKGTEFEGTIQLVSGASFPDIVAGKYYGVEVKSTEKNHWTSIGSSILESTRNANVERIYLTFGKLGKPVQFLSRPYEECLSGIAVTHYPRYQIDMRLQAGETIFDKMQIAYDDLRNLDNPVAPVSRYYKERLKPGESLWWAADDIEAVSPATVRLWSALSQNEREMLAVQGYALFPEVLGSASRGKYNRYALWLATRQGVVNTNIRDSFSAGGKVALPTSKYGDVLMPASFGRISKYRDFIQAIIYEVSENLLKEYWQVDKIEENRMRQWARFVVKAISRTVDFGIAMDVLNNIYPEISSDNIAYRENPKGKIWIPNETKIIPYGLK